MESLKFQAMVLTDNPGLKADLKELMDAENLEVDFVRSYEKASLNLNKHHYDLVVSEICLKPGKKEGLDLLKGLRERDRDLPFVLIGTQESIADSVQAVNYGVSAFLLLPLDLEEAREAFARTIRHHKSRFQKNELINYQMTNQYQVVIRSSERSSLKLLDTVDNLIELIYPEEYGSFPDLKMAIYEGLTNAVEHGNQKDPEKNIYFQIFLMMDRILVQIKDEGRGFEADKAMVGGDLMHRGLKLISHLMDEVTFNHQGNEINFLKLLPQEAQMNPEYRRT
ncbi:MAG: ATP-binding protein [bacterium]|nr:ATP-binding protein [bacterium]